MTFWMIDAQAIGGEFPDFAEHISMPEYNEQDWSNAKQPKHIKQRLKAADDTVPPETIASIAQTIWRFVGKIEQEDIICAVEKQQGKLHKVYFAEVVGDVEYNAQAQQHRVKVQWFEEVAGALRLRPHAPALLDADHWPRQIGDAKLRLALRNYLPLPGNKFVKWKWLIITLIIIKIVVIGSRMLNKM